MNLPKVFQPLVKKCLVLTTNSLDDFSSWKFDGRLYFFKNVADLCLVLKISWKDKWRWLWSVKRSRGDRVLFFKILNGYSFFNISAGLVLKVVDKSLEPNFLDNIKTAFKSLPRNVPRIIESGRYKKYDYFVSELLPDTKKVTWKEWDKVLPKITSLMNRVYFANKVKPVLASNYFERLKKEMKEECRKGRFLNSELKEVMNLFELSWKKYALGSGQIYRVFCHGDLVPNNVVVFKGKYYLLDWDNGGYQNIFYDLFMQDFYFEDKSVWSDFDKIDFRGELGPDYFWGWTNQYLKMLSRGLRVTFTNQQIKMSLIGCLAEIALKNYKRHQSTKNLADGRAILDLTINHFKSILR